MPGSFTLEIVTPAQQFYQGEVTSLQAPGLDGYFGILHNRAPLISALGPGQLKFEEVGDGPRFVAITGGFFQVHQNRAVVLADEAVFGEDIDRETAEREVEEARQRLLGLITSDEERERWRRALQEAQTRIRVASQVRR